MISYTVNDIIKPYTFFHLQLQLQSKEESELAQRNKRRFSNTQPWLLFFKFEPFYKKNLPLLPIQPNYTSFTMQSQSESPNKPMSTLSQLVQNMFNNNFMLVAIVSFLLVILFVLLLYMYAKLFLAPAQPHRRRTSATVEPSRFHHFHFIETSPISTKGLDSSTVLRIPMFVYEAEAETEELECVICLSGFEEGETGRSLPNCGHAFHLECIDMWLSSHCTCPICRAPIMVQNNDDDDVLEIVIGTPSYEISDGESDNYGGSGASVSQTSSSLLLGCSLKRMLSKVFQSSNVNELDGSH